jgi:5'-nucleotidase
MRRLLLTLVAVVVLVVGSLKLCALLRAQAGDDPSSSRAILSIIGTTDLHGYYMERDGRGGLGVFGGYVKNLRAAREADGGAVLLLDAGDAFQGGVDSNLSEGALIVDGYNALGYNALAIGNHEFDFGAADRPGAREDPRDDPRGALKALAARAHFPFLAANLVDELTGQRVDWPNVRASTVVDTAVGKVGVIGVMTAAAMRATLPLNVRGLRTSPLADAIRTEATRLRAAAVPLIVVAAHAGGFCDRFDDPHDLWACDGTAEIFDVARDLEPGLVDAIVAGHTHAALAHIVNGIPIVQSYFAGQAFGRIDLTIDRASGRAVAGVPFRPHFICAEEDPRTHECATAGDSTARLPPARYEGRPIADDHDIDEAMRASLARVQHLRDQPIGVTIESPIARTGSPESPLGNLFADALREQTGADVALNNNSFGGLRADLGAGLLTFGRLYDTFPFDNRLVQVTVTADALASGIGNALRRGRRGTFGISGVSVVARCVDNRFEVNLFRPEPRVAGDHRLDPSETIVLVGMDSMLGGQLFVPALSPGAVRPPVDAPLVREVVEDWLRRRGGDLRTEDFVDPEHPRLRFDGSVDACIAQ